MLKLHVKSLLSPTSGKNRRNTNHSYTDIAFRNNDKMPVDVLFLWLISSKIEGTKYFEKKMNILKKIQVSP